jgi:hypothetical protein
LWAPAGVLATDSGDLQYWATTSLNFDLDKDWAVSLEEQFRLENDTGNLFYYHTDLGLTYKGFAEWLDLGLNFRQVDQKDSSGTFRNENRPHINLTVKSKLLGLDVSNRARLEYRDREVAQDSWRYRHQTTVKFPLQISEWKLQPYMADEFFINLGEDNVSRNRVFSGFLFKVSQNLKGSIFYMWERKKISGGRQDANIIGGNLKLYF